MTTEVPVTPDAVALIDQEDLPKVAGFSWNLHSKGYATAYAGGGRKSQRYVMMHRLILGVTSGDIDHVNGNRLDNRKTNLRPATRTQNNANKPKRVMASSRFKGVRFHKQNSKWTAQIGYEGKSIYLGSFLLEEEAAHAYDQAARRYFGEYAQVNFHEHFC